MNSSATTSSPLLLGIDCGTQSTKACVFDLDGRQVAAAGSPNTVDNPRENWAEQDPGQWWLSLKRAVRDALRSVNSSRIAALGLAYQRETFTLVDRAGHPVRPGILWLDTRAQEELHDIERLWGAGAYHRATGKPLDATSAVARMLWLRKHEPDVVKTAARWVDVCSYVVSRLTGRHSTCAAGTDTCGLIDLHSQTWIDAHLDACGLKRDHMPDLVAPGRIVGALTGSAARETGLPAGLPVVLAGGDGQVFSIGMGASAAHSVSLTLGTSIVLGISHEKPLHSPIFRTLRSCVEGSFLLECVLQSGTYLLRWFLDEFGGKDSSTEDHWEDQARKIPPGSDGLVALPHWWGIRFPEHVPQARGAILGWSHRHGRAHLYRCLLEGTGFELKRTILELEKTSFSRKTLSAIHAGGGGMRSAVWPLILADILDTPLKSLSIGEATALGAALMAGVGAGFFQDIAQAAESMVNLDREILPDPGRAASYNRTFRNVYVPAFESLTAIYRKAPQPH
ncbi:MAG: hypothetical protein GF418_05975 [Chitinivibrionales bacterium]|nr:hypothetical protein [Chitinivibrionales bacterium]MBD3395159.1 hypothetical protein [Chitinivibrionales bacterium]